MVGGHKEHDGPCRWVAVRALAHEGANSGCKRAGAQAAQGDSRIILGAGKRFPQARHGGGARHGIKQYLLETVHKGRNRHQHDTAGEENLCARIGRRLSVGNGRMHTHLDAPERDMPLLERFAEA